jgi:hypothetical protein
MDGSGKDMQDMLEGVDVLNVLTKQKEDKQPKEIYKT